MARFISSRFYSSSLVVASSNSLHLPRQPIFPSSQHACPIRVQLQENNEQFYLLKNQGTSWNWCTVRGQTKSQLNTWLKLFLLNVTIIPESCKFDFAVPSPPFIPMWIREIFVQAAYKYFLLGLDLSCVLVRDLACLCQYYLPYFLHYIRTISSKVCITCPLQMAIGNSVRLLIKFSGKTQAPPRTLLVTGSIQFYIYLQYLLQLKKPFSW